MSEEIGPLAFGRREEHVFLGKEIIQARDYSEETAKKIDEQISLIITQTYQGVKNLLKKHINLLHKLAQILLEKETIDGATLDKLITEGTN